MVGDSMTARRVDNRGVIELLERSREPGSMGLAFDADGTLWSGDVGEDVFEYATANELLRTDPLDTLCRVAEAHGLDTHGSSSQVAASIYAAYRRGVVDERKTCEVMTWAYAGFSASELTEIAELAFQAGALRSRVRHVLDPVFKWARDEHARIAVISASPHIVVEAGLSHAEISVECIMAGHAAVKEGRLTPEMAAPLPYGHDKRTAGERALEGSLWLASFGDNAFDTEMLRTARVGVAVCPKPALVARLSDLPNTVVLE